MAASIATKLAVSAAALVLLLQASSFAAAARRHQEPRPAAVSSAKLDSGTPAVMTVNGFQRGEEGGGPSECDGHYHSDRDMIAALSTGWYDHGSRCHKTIRITSVRNGRTVEAQVVDECDSRRGCRNNIVDTSRAVWEALGLDTNIGEVAVTWSDA